MRSYSTGAVTQDITFPLLKEEFVKFEEDNACVPQDVTFPTIKDEVLDDEEHQEEEDEEYVWWDLKPDKNELKFTAVKDEVIDHDYQTGVLPFLDQDVPAHCLEAEGESHDLYDDEFLSNHGRHTNKFIIDFDPEELDESLYKYITSKHKEGVKADICDDRFVFEEQMKYKEEDEETVIYDMSKDDFEDESTTPQSHLATYNDNENVIVIYDDETMVKDDSSSNSSKDKSDHYDVIVIDDDDDDDYNLNDEHQLENCPTKTEIRNLDSSESHLDVGKTMAKKRQRKQDKSKIKCIVLQNGNESSESPVTSSCKNKNAAENKKEAQILYTKLTEVGEQCKIQESHPVNAVQSASITLPRVSKDFDMSPQKTINSEHSVVQVEAATIGNHSDYSLNTPQSSVSIERPQRISNLMQKQQLKSLQELEQHDMQAHNIKTNISAQESKQSSRSMQEMKQSDVTLRQNLNRHHQEKEQHKIENSSQDLNCCIQPVKKPLVFVRLVTRLRSCFTKLFTSVEHITIKQQIMFVYKINLGLDQCIQLITSAQELVESKLGLFHFIVSAKELQNYIRLIKELMSFPEYETGKQQRDHLLKIRTNGVLLLKCLQQCGRILKDVILHHPLSNKLLRSEAMPMKLQQRQYANRNFQKNNYFGTDSVHPKQPVIKSKSINSHNSQQFIQFVNENCKQTSLSSENLHHNKTTTDQQQMDQTLDASGSGVNSINESQQNGELVSNSTQSFMSEIISKHKCTLCSKTLKSPRGLKAHIKRMHPSTVPSHCLECRKEFPSKDLLAIHNKHYHLMQVSTLQSKQRSSVIEHVAHGNNPAQKLSNSLTKKRSTNLVHPVNVHKKQTKPAEDFYIQQKSNSEYEKYKNRLRMGVNPYERQLDTTNWHHTHSSFSHVHSKPATSLSCPAYMNSKYVSEQSSPASACNNSTLLQSSHTVSYSTAVPLQQASSSSYSSPSTLQSTSISSYSNPDSLQQCSPLPSSSEFISMQQLSHLSSHSESMPQQYSRPIPLQQSSSVSSHSASNPLQNSSPVSSQLISNLLQRNLTPSHPRPNSLQAASLTSPYLRHDVLHSHAAPMHLDKVPIVHKSNYVQKVSKARSYGKHRTTVAEHLSRVTSVRQENGNLLKAGINGRQTFLSGHKVAGLDANHSFCIDQRETQDSEFSKENTIQSTDMVWQKEKNFTANNGDMSACELGPRNAAECDPDLGISINDFSAPVLMHVENGIQATNDKSCSNTSMVPKLKYSTNRLDSIAVHSTITDGELPDRHHVMNAKMADQQSFGSTPLEYNQLRIFNPPNSMDFMQQQFDYKGHVGNLLPTHHSKFKCRHLGCGPFCAEASSSDVCKTVFATNITEQRLIPADLLQHSPEQASCNHSQQNYVSSNMCDRQVTHVKSVDTQPLIVANYNSVTVIQNHIPCVV